MLHCLGSYRYRALPKGDVFRYLVLNSGFGDGTLVCSLYTAPIDGTKFSAISYVWGSNDKDHAIICNGRRMMITPSLAAALRSVRLPNEALTLWADGICIDQESVEDKNHQVSRMGKIYRAAQRVLMYMGPDDDDEGPTAHLLVEDVNTMIQDGFEKGTISFHSLPYPEAEDDPVLDTDRWESLYWLLREDWFSRGWVVQEAAVARKAEIIWGQTRIDWDKLMRAFLWLTNRAPDIVHSVQFNHVNMNAHVMIYAQTHEDFGRIFCGDYMFRSPSILNILNCAKELSLTDPRDRIYAFCDLPHLPIPIAPDYHASPLEVYRQFAVYHLQSTKTLEILDYISHDEHSFMAGCSWAPRWDIPTWPLSFASSATEVLLSRTKTQSPATVDNTCLSARGVIIDVVHHISNIFEWDTTTHELVKEIWDHIQDLEIESPYVETKEMPDRRLHAFLESLCGGLSAGDELQWKHEREEFANEARLKPNPLEENESTMNNDRNIFPDLERCTSNDQRSTQGSPVCDQLEFVEGTASDDSETEENEPNLYHRVLKIRTYGRRFIVTRRGYMGLAPAISRVGDSIAIFFGCQTPCILRETDAVIACNTPLRQHYLHLGCTPLMGNKFRDLEVGGFCNPILGEEISKDWLDWNLEEQDIHLS